MKAITVFVVTLAVTGCATTLNPEYQASLDSWVGRPVVEFFAVHPEPNSMIDMIDYRIYVWNSTEIITGSNPDIISCTPGVDLGTGVTTAPTCVNYGGGSYSATSSCAWKLYVKDNVVTDATLTGDGCEKKERPVPRSAGNNKSAEGKPE